MVSGPGLNAAQFAHAQRTEAAAHAAGLDFFEVLFEPLDACDVNAVAAYGGFPRRYASWRFGMDFERLHKSYSYGLSKIYELVINNDPTIAYLVRSNSIMEQKLVMAHVFGHADFFKHNTWFAPTERHMVDVMERHAEQMQASLDAHGVERVETFLDAVLSLDTLIDPYLPQRERMRQGRRDGEGVDLRERARLALEAVLDGEPKPGAKAAPSPSDPPTYDILGFLLEHAPLLSWQREIVRMVRAEAYYFLPQRMTKIINEGWASFWHSRLLTSGLLEPSEIVDFADCHSGATATGPGQLNPYKLGIDLFRHAERRGLDIFHLRRIHNDVSFIDEVMDESFAAKSQLFVVEHDGRTGEAQVGSRDWRQVKERLLQNLTWCGSPRVELIGADENGCGELLLRHHHDGRDIRLAEAGDLLRNLSLIWGTSVHLLSLDEGQERRVSVDGDSVRVLGADAPLESEGPEPEQPKAAG
jgi:stage V sporulation protein R